MEEFIETDVGGTTSAYAEKSHVTIRVVEDKRNYLRIRGEKSNTAACWQGKKELPPHTRRKALEVKKSVTTMGTTSAYAEKRMCF
ncbi:hypothetical protein CULC0102_1881 [Corynebacterium ulcerans 0102]|nr:hypothetical protein CULC0102_1881 [Corynebacterium ulcerans 0102]